nr:hypothetical protein 12 [Elusimicrobiota bacterium]
MGIIEKMLSKLGFYKANRITELIGGNGFFDFTQYGAPKPYNYSKYLSAYRNEVWVYACVYLIATTIAGLPYKIVRYTRRRGNLEKLEISGHPAERLIDKPNRNDENSTWFNLLEWTIANMELCGDAYWLQDEVAGGRPYSLQLLMTSKIKVKPGKDRYIDGYIYNKNNGTEVVFDPDIISHFKYMSVDDYYYGQSSFSPCRWSIDVIKEAQKTNLNIFKNGARLDGVLETDKTLSEPLYKRVLGQFNQRYSGVDNAHKTAILENGLKYKTIVASMKDLEFIEGIKLSREDICACFGVPPVLVGILDRATYNNYSESLKIFWSNTIIPKLKRLEPVITNIVQKYDKNAFFEFDISDIEALKEDEKTKADIAKVYFSMGIPVNEIIQAFNLPFNPVKGGDTGYLPLNLMAMGSENDNRKTAKQWIPDQQLFGNDNKKKYTVEKKRQLWKQFERVTAKIEKRYHKVIDVFFTEQEQKVIRNLDKHKSQKLALNVEDILFNETEEIKRWRRYSNEIHKITMKINGDRELDNLGHIELRFDLEAPHVRRFLEQYSLEKSKEIIGTARDTVKKELLEGLKEGEGIPALKKRIMDVYEPYKNAGYKAERIARTEIIGTSNRAALESYRMVDVGIKKSWLNEPDARDTHIKAGRDYSEDNAIPLDDEFNVGQGRGLHPGGIGLAEEDIQCRCTVLPVVPED